MKSQMNQLRDMTKKVVSKTTIITLMIGALSLFNGCAIAQTEEGIFANGQEIFLHKNAEAGLRSFLARNVGGKTYLAWVTENFNNEGSFLIYRSSDGENYEIIGVQQTYKMPRTGELGYFFIDQAPITSSTVFYKVLHLGTDNSFFKSPCVSVKATPLNFAGNMSAE